MSRSERRPAILVIKNDANIAAFARDALEETGYRVVTAETAEHALTLFVQAGEHDKSRFILVFTDVIMPGAMNGVALTKEIRARDPGGPVLLTIGYNDQMSLDGPQSGGLGVLRKSFRRDEVRYRHIPYLLCLFIDVDGVDTRVHRLLSWFRSHEARRCPTTRCCSRTSSSTSHSATGS